MEQNNALIIFFIKQYKAKKILQICVTYQINKKVRKITKKEGKKCFCFKYLMRSRFLKNEKKTLPLFTKEKLQIKLMNSIIEISRKRKQSKTLFDVLNKFEIIDEQQHDMLRKTLIGLKSSQLFYIQKKLSECLMKTMRKKNPQQKQKIEKILKCVQLKLKEFSHQYTYSRLLKCLEYFFQNKGNLPTSIEIPEAQELYLSPHHSSFDHFRQLVFGQEKNTYSINTYVDQITRNKKQLMDLSCTGCLRFFYEGWRITDQLSSTNIIYLNKQDNRNQNQFKKYACALLNAGGGYLICGVNLETYQVEGQIVSEKTKTKYTEIIREVIEKVKPNYFKSQIGFVPVYSNPFEPKKNSEPGRYLIRISFQPDKLAKKIKIFYSKTQKKGGATHYKLYLKQKNKAKQLFGQDIYKACLYLQNKKKSKQIDHNCHEPEPGLLLQGSEDDFQQMDKKKINKINPKYKNSSIISVGTANKMSLIDNFLEQLKKNKVLFETTHPFEQYQPSNGRQTFFLSHEERYDNLKEILAEIQPASQPRLQKVNLEITMATGLTKMNEKKFNELFKKFFQIDSERPYELKYSHEKNGNYQQPKFKFKNLNESVFAYIGFEHLGIRCSFEKR